MSETAYAATMKAVVAELHPRLKERGFRKRRHTFNREPEPGLVQVVNFQMGPHEIGDAPDPAGLRIDLYGKFAVNLGVFLEAEHESFDGVRRPAFVSEYHCQIRRRLGELISDEGEIWWNLDRDHRAIAAAVGDPLERVGLAWLDRFSSRAAILQAWYREGNRIGLMPRGRVVIALVHWHRGEKSLAERLVREYLDGDVSEGHAAYVRRALDRVGMRVG